MLHTIPPGKMVETAVHVVINFDRNFIVPAAVQKHAFMNTEDRYMWSAPQFWLQRVRLQQRYLPTRMNWVVQSSAVDYMHLMLACMRWLIKQYSIKARFSISIHDELRYICADEDRWEYITWYAKHSSLVFENICNIRTGTWNLTACSTLVSSTCLAIAKWSSLIHSRLVRYTHW